MVKKIKQAFLVFMCTILLVTNISISAIKPLTVKATGAEIAVVGGVAYEGLMLLLDAIAAGLVSIGAYELYENDERFSQVVDTYLGGLTGTWDETVNKWIPYGKDEHYGETWLHDPSSPESVWEPTGELVSLTEEEAAKLGLSGAQVLSWEEYVSLFNQKAEEYARENHPEWFENEGSGGGGDDNNDNNNHPTHDWKAMLKDYWNSNSDTIAKIGSGLIISVSSFLDKLTLGETGNETIDSWVNEIPKPSYTGTLIPDSDGIYLINFSGSFEYQSPSNGLCRQEVSGTASASGKPYCLFNPNYGYSLMQYSNGKKSEVSVSGTRIYTKRINSETGVGSSSTYELSGLGGLSGAPTTQWLSICVPVFLYTDSVGLDNFLNNNDDSSCINKEEPQKLVWADMNTLSNALPSTLSAFSTLPEGKAIKATALKDYVNDMTSYKSTATPSDLSNPDTQTQTATQTAQQAVEKNTVDTKTDTEEKEEEKPIFVPPSTTPIDIDGSEVTRDWRLVFPFCIPFDIIDLFTTLIAEPVAPRFEFPMQFPDYGIDYTFVIDFNDFELLAKVFRTCETVLFILSLCILTGKVIKW